MSEDKQIMLFDGDDKALESVTEESAKARECKQGVYSGVQLKETDPERYTLVLNLLASGRFTWRDIRQATGVSMGLISGILKLQSHDIEAIKKEQASESRMIAGMTNQMVIQWLRDTLDDPAKIKKMTPSDIQKLATAGAIHTDKALVQTGQATGITEFKPVNPGDDEFEAAMRRAKAGGRLQYADAAVSAAPYSEQMDTEAESSQTKGTVAAADPLELAADPDDTEPAAGPAEGGGK